MARQDKTSFLRLTLDQQLGVFFRGRILNLLILFGVISSLDLIWQLLVVKICYEIFWCKVHVVGQQSTVWTACVATQTITSLQSVFESWSQEWNCPPPPLHYTYFSSFYYFIIDANAQQFGSPKCHIGSFLIFPTALPTIFFVICAKRPFSHRTLLNTHNAPSICYL